MSRNYKLVGCLLFLLAIVLLITTCDTFGSGKYFTVSFNADGGEPAPEKQRIPKGGLIVEPEEMVRKDFNFGSWYRDSACTRLWDFTRDVVTEDIILYAKWKPVTGVSTGGGSSGGGGGGPGANVPQTITASSYNITTPLVGDLITSADGSYTANNGGAAGTHLYQWKRADNAAGTSNVLNLAATKDYTTVGADFGKYIWIETTPVGDGSLSGTAVRGAVLRVGLRLNAAVAGGSGGTATVNSAGSAIVYGQANITVTRNVGTDVVAWTALPVEGTFGNAALPATTYTPAATPTTGTITLTAYLGTTYTVTFVDSVGGNTITPITGLSSGATITAPFPAPTTSVAGATLDRFRGWYTDDLTFASLYSFGTPITTNITLYADWGYRLGDDGPGGGKIFHRDDAGFTVEGYGTPGVGSGFANYTAYYLEAAPTNSGTAQWGSYGTEISGVTNFTVSTDPLASRKGNGRKDTQIIAAYLTAPDTDRAAQLCAAYTFGGYNDWFLPSLGELDLLYQNKGAAGITGMDTDYYWSSSQDGIYRGWAQHFNTGTQSNYAKSNTDPVRAIRAF